jgi:two-component system chemotaxis response regulator CheY
MATIVLAEDDIHIIRVVSVWLRKHEHEVFEAPNGKRALEILRSRPVDVLVTDVNMPVMDGIALVRTCAAEGLPRVGTIMLTSRCDHGEIVHSLGGPAIVFHPKPFSPSRLMAEVEALVARAGADMVVADAAPGREI